MRKIFLTSLALMAAFGGWAADGALPCGRAGGAADWGDVADLDGAAWISAADAPVRGGVGGTADGTACFVKTVANGRAVARAVWTVAGLGVFEAYVNGRPVSHAGAPDDRAREFLKPGFTHNAKTKYAFAYDVTHLVKTGAGEANTFAAQVSSGWWRDGIVDYFGTKSAFRARLTLHHTDGTVTRVGTDATWRSAMAGPVLRAGIFDGEDYDARRAADLFAVFAGRPPPAAFRPSETNTEFRGEVLLAAATKRGPPSADAQERVPPVVATKRVPPSADAQERVPPVVATTRGPSGGGVADATVCLRRDLAFAPVGMYVWKGVTGADADRFGTVVKVRGYADGETVRLDAGETLVIDFGQNAAAVPSFTFRAAAGTTLTARPAEMLNDGNGARARRCDEPDGAAYVANYRAARSTLTYTFAGAGADSDAPQSVPAGGGPADETYRPDFTYFGYRYLSVTATGPVEIRRVRSIPVTSIRRDMETGTIETGHAGLNRLISNIRWSLLSNYLSVPTDCPQRDERLGWLADAQIFARAAAYSADVSGFLTKWMRDVRDTVHADGSYPGAAPLAPRGSERRHHFGWADAGVIVPWTVWRQYGETRIIDENWDAMAAYLALTERHKYTSPDALEHQWADWLSFEDLEGWRGTAYEKGPDGRRRPKAAAQTYWRYLGCCYWLMDAEMMAEMAAATGRDAAAWRTMAARARAYLREHFITPGDGKANKELIAVLAEAFDLPKSAVVFKGGETSKTKRLLLRGVSAAVAHARLAALR